MEELGVCIFGDCVSNLKLKEFVWQKIVHIEERTVCPVELWKLFIQVKCLAVGCVQCWNETLPPLVAQGVGFSLRSEILLGMMDPQLSEP